MSLLSVLLGEANREPGGCVIEVGPPYSDAKVIPLYPALREVTVDVARGKAGEARIVMSTRRGQDGRWDVEDSGVFVDWTPVRISAAFGRRRKEILRGVVREIEVQHPPDIGDSSVTITVQDLSLVADREHRRKIWGSKEAPTNDFALVSEILKAYDLSLQKGSGAGLSATGLTQDGTDAAFLRSRAEANGYELLYEEDGVYFGPLRTRLSAPSTQATILVGAGTDTNCLSVVIEVDGRRPDVVRVAFADGAKGQGEAITAKPSLPLLGRDPVRSSGPEHNLAMSGQAGADREQLQRAAQAKADELSMKIAVKGELDSTGYGHVLRVGRTVRVEGVGPRFSGTHLVDSVIHRFTPDGYTQRFRLLRNAYTDDASPALPSAIASVLAS